MAAREKTWIRPRPSPARPPTSARRTTGRQNPRPIRVGQKGASSLRRAARHRQARQRARLFPIPARPRRVRVAVVAGGVVRLSKQSPRKPMLRARRSRATPGRRRRKGEWLILPRQGRKMSRRTMPKRRPQPRARQKVEQRKAEQQRTERRSDRYCGCAIATAGGVAGPPRWGCCRGTATRSKPARAHRPRSPRSAPRWRRDSAVSACRAGSAVTRRLPVKRARHRPEEPPRKRRSALSRPNRPERRRVRVGADGADPPARPRRAPHRSRRP